MPVPVLGLQDRTKVFKDGSCQLTDDSFVLIGSFVAFFIPLVIMVVTYFLTISALQSQATLCLDQLIARPKWLSMLDLVPRGSLSSERLFSRTSLCPDTIVPSTRPFIRRTAQSISNEQKASKVLGVVFFLFVIMWCPFFITNVMAVVCDSSTCDPALMIGLLNVFVWVGYLSSAVNPLVYTLFNKTYRAAFARYIRCRYREPSRPLQVILVNTIPPLAFHSSKLPIQGDNSLRHSKDDSGFGTSSYTNQVDSLNKRGRDEMVSHVWIQNGCIYFMDMRIAQASGNSATDSQGLIQRKWHLYIKHFLVNAILQWWCCCLKMVPKVGCCSLQWFFGICLLMKMCLAGKHILKI